MISTCCGSFKAMVAKQARQVEIKSCGGFGDRVHLKQHSFTNYQQLHVNTYVHTLLLVNPRQFEQLDWRGEEWGQVCIYHSMITHSMYMACVCSRYMTH